MKDEGKRMTDWLKDISNAINAKKHKPSYDGEVTGVPTKNMIAVPAEALGEK